MFLCSLDVELTLGQVHRARNLGDIVGSLVEEDGHGCAVICMFEEMEGRLQR